jgi:hypothetical protein
MISGKESEVFSIKPAVCLVVILSLVILTGCGAKQTAPDKNGVVHVDGFLPDRAHDEFKFSDGVVLTHGDPDVGHWARVKYNDGDEVSVYFSLGEGAGLSTGEAFDAVCKNYSNCPYAVYQRRNYGVAPLDGQDWMDTDLWLLVGFDIYKEFIKYQACRDNRFYSAADLKTLMDVMDKVDKDPVASKSDPEVQDHLLTDDALERRLPVCNWRHRISLDSAYPTPANLEKVRILPASHSRTTYVEIKTDRGSVDVYVDEGKKRLDKFVFVSPKGSSTLRPVYEGNDCATFDRCEHFVFGPEKKPGRFDIRSLDGEPLSNSRIFEVDDTISGAKNYDGCAGGRLYSGKNRHEIENEVKEAIANPAPPPVQGAPMMGAPETSESGDVVIPDTFCDWAFRREQAEAIKKSQAAR